MIHIRSKIIASLWKHRDSGKDAKYILMSKHYAYATLHEVAGDILEVNNKVTAMADMKSEGIPVIVCVYADDDFIEVVS